MSGTEKPSVETLKAQLWRAGKLRYKLHAGQKKLYDEYRAWEAQSYADRKAGLKLAGLYPRVYLADCSRRFGKDYWACLIRIEDAIRKPNGLFSYATAYGKDISSIVVPIIELICEDAPLDIKPVYRQAMQGSEGGFYFPNGSVIKLVGIDRNPDALRGRYSDGITISEAGFVDKLEYALLSVLMPMLQGRLDATIILNSTPPEAPGTFYDTNITPDCRDHGRYALRTIDDNPMLGEAEKEEFIAAAGGRDSDRCKREYFCIRIRSEDLVVIPEFNRAKHVASSAVPPWALGFTVIDPGVRDLCAVIVAYYDFLRAKLVVKRSWAKRGANTLEVAAAIRELEEAVFGKNGTALRFWNGRAIAANPFQRFSDTEARLILDLSTLHKLRVAPADKVDAEAALNALRVAIKSDKIEIDPEAKEVASHLENAVWNTARTSYARSDVYGHFDCVDAMKYLWRMASPSFRLNPTPPAAYLHTGGHQNMLWKASDWSHGSSIYEKLSKILPKRRKSHTS